MEMDTYETLKEQKRKDAMHMTRLFGDYRCMDDAWNDAYEIIEKEEKEKSRDTSYTPSIPSVVGIVGAIGEYLNGNYGSERDDD